LEDLDVNDADDRSDLEFLETDEGVKAVRTTLVEEQSVACQLVVLLAEKLQEHFFPYVEPSIRAMEPLVNSPHEDVRSYSLVALPEFVRATGKATIPNREQLKTITEYALGILTTATESEEVLEIIMTALQALKLVINYASRDWSAWDRETRPLSAVKSGGGSNGSLSGLSSALANAENSGSNSSSGLKCTDDPPQLTPETSVRFLNNDQMIAILNTAKVRIHVSYP
jgi:hypothetical protein